MSHDYGSKIDLIALIKFFQISFLENDFINKHEIDRLFCIIDRKKDYLRFDC